MEDGSQIEHVDCFNTPANSYGIESTNIITGSADVMTISLPQHISSFTESILPTMIDSSPKALTTTRATANPPSLSWSISEGQEVLMNIQESEFMETVAAPPSFANPTELPLSRSLQVMARSAYSEHINAYEMCVVMSYSGENQTLDVRR